jgi:hypothetical protein
MEWEVHVMIFRLKLRLTQSSYLRRWDWSMRWTSYLDHIGNPTSFEFSTIRGRFDVIVVIYMTMLPWLRSRKRTRAARAERVHAGNVCTVGVYILKILNENLQQLRNRITSLPRNARMYSPSSQLVHGRTNWANFGLFFFLVIFTLNDYKKK